MIAGTCITYEDMYHQVYMINDDVSRRRRFALKSKVQSL